jgi:LPPG:FO 2-phospho-L-lactate transferase
MITALCGGVGGSKLTLGLYRVLPPDSLTVVVNTADDLDFCGLHVSPDLDTVTYTLAGMARQDVGWGIEGDTFHALDTLARYGAPSWFQVGDRDLATHVFRSEALRRGETLTDVTKAIVRSLRVRAEVLPMTDAPVATRLRTRDEWLDFQEYFVRRRHRDAVDEVRYDGIETAQPTGAVVKAIASAELLVLVNSNPVLSILPILSLPGVRKAVLESRAARVAVSPIVGRHAVTGPAGDLMRLIGCASSATGVAEAYRGLIDGIIIDRRDADQVPEIEALGVEVLCTDTIMSDLADRERLAGQALDFARSLR